MASGKTFRQIGGQPRSRNAWRERPCVWRTRGCAIRPDWLPRPWLPPSRSHPTRVILKQEATRRSLRRGRLNFLARAEYGTTSLDRVGDRAPRRSLSGSLRRACSDQPDATDPRTIEPKLEPRAKDQFLCCAARFLKSNHCNIRGAIFLELRTRDVLFMPGFRENVNETGPSAARRL